MSQFRVKTKKKSFAQISNAILQNPKLPHAARGLLCFALSFPEGVDLKIDSLRVAKDISGKRLGRASLNTMLFHLQHFGHASLIRGRTKKGTMFQVWEFWEDPFGWNAEGSEELPSNMERVLVSNYGNRKPKADNSPQPESGFPTPVTGVGFSDAGQSNSLLNTKDPSDPVNTSVSLNPSFESQTESQGEIDIDIDPEVNPDPQTEVEPGLDPELNSNPPVLESNEKEGEIDIEPRAATNGLVEGTKGLVNGTRTKSLVDEIRKRYWEENPVYEAEFEVGPANDVQFDRNLRKLQNLGVSEDELLPILASNILIDRVSNFVGIRNKESATDIRAWNTAQIEAGKSLGLGTQKSREARHSQIYRQLEEALASEQVVYRNAKLFLSGKYGNKFRAEIWQYVGYLISALEEAYTGGGLFQPWEVDVAIDLTLATWSGGRIFLQKANFEKHRTPRS